MLTNNYIFNFERKLFYVDNYKNIDKIHFRLINEMMNKKNEDWVNKNNFKKIRDEDKM